MSIARLAVHVVASVGVSKVVHDIIRNNTVVVTSFDAARVLTGSLVIGSVIGDHCAKHVNQRIDDAIAWNTARKSDQ